MKTSTSLPIALDYIRRGQLIIITDRDDREGEADLFLPAVHATPAAVNFMITEGRGLVCAPLSAERAAQLELPLMVPREMNEEPHRCQFTVSVDSRHGTTTGISAADRAATLQLLANPQATAADFVRPGHVFPLVAAADGLRERDGHTEAALALCQLAGLPPVGVICEILNADGTAANGRAVMAFADRHQLPVIAAASIAASTPAPKPSAPLARHVATAKLPTAFGEFQVYVFANLSDGKPHVALGMGDLSRGTPVLVRVHSQCLTGDTFRSLKCDCHGQLQAALQQIAAVRHGVLLYLNQEGRGIGLVNKIRAYALQEQGLDTVEANLALGLAADVRNYRVAAEMLRALQVNHIILLTNNPEKVAQLKAAGIDVQRRVPLVVAGNGVSDHYLHVKVAKLGHRLTDDSAAAELPYGSSKW